MAKQFYIVQQTETKVFFKMADSDFRFNTTEYKTIGKIGKKVATLVHENGYKYNTHYAAGEFWGVFIADYSAFKI